MIIGKQGEQFCVARTHLVSSGFALVLLNEALSVMVTDHLMTTENCFKLL